MQKKNVWFFALFLICCVFSMTLVGCVSKKSDVKKTVIVGPDEEVLVVPKDRNVFIPGEKILEIPGEGEGKGTMIQKK